MWLDRFRIGFVVTLEPILTTSFSGRPDQVGTGANRPGKRDTSCRQRP